MSNAVQEQLLLLQKKIDQINAKLDKMLGLTEAMGEALELDETDQFAALMEKRQLLMDDIDDLNRQVRKLRIALELDQEQQEGKQQEQQQIEPLLSRRRQLLQNITKQDKLNRETALLRNEQYKATLREVKNKRLVQSYEQESLADSGSIFIDQKG